MRIAIFGSTGVLGRALVPLLQQRKYNIRAFARSKTKAHNLFPQLSEIVICDLLLTKPKDLPAMLDGCDVVLHIATSIPVNFTDPGAMKVNSWLRTTGTKMLLDASLAAGVRRYIQQSIIMAYPGNGDKWINEEMPLDSSPQRKGLCAPVITMEQMIKNISPKKLEWSVLRGGTFVGRNTFQDNTIKKLKMAGEIIPGDGNNFISLIHVQDMANAFVLAIEKAPSGSVFNIVDEPVRQGIYLDRLADLTGAAQPVRDINLPAPPSWRCSNRLAKSILGWRPRHNFYPQSNSVTRH